MTSLSFVDVSDDPCVLYRMAAATGLKVESANGRQHLRIGGIVFSAEVREVTA